MAKDDYARLSPQARMVLYLLGLTKGGCTEKVLGELMGMSDIAMERHVGELLRQGWVRLEGDRLAVCGDADSLSLSLSLMAALPMPYAAIMQESIRSFSGFRLNVCAR